MSLLQIPTTPPQSTPIEVDRGDPALPGLLSRAYWLFLSGLQSVMQLMATAVDYLQTNVVYGGPSLTHVNRVTKVTAAGTIGEAAFVESDVVRGAANLTHVGRLPKVSAASTLTESSTTDDGTNVSFTEPIHSDLGAAPANSPVTLKANALGALALQCLAADNISILFDAERVAGSTIATQGAAGAGTAGRIVKNAGLLQMQYKGGLTVGDVIAAFLAAIALDLATGNAGFGGNIVPGYAVDATGDVNASGVFRKGGTAGLTVVITTAKLTPAGANGSQTFSGGILTAQTAAT